jgi:alpha-L-rhamnosidase
MRRFYPAGDFVSIRPGQIANMNIRFCLFAALSVFVLASRTVLGSPVTINDPSFENFVLSDGLEDNSYLPSGWGGTATVRGLSNPVNSKFPNTTGSPGTLPSPADGKQYIWANGAGSYWYDTGPIQANCLYTLTVAVGQRLDIAAGDIQIALLNGTNNTGALLNGAALDASTIPLGSFTNVTVVFSTGAAATGDLTILLQSFSGVQNQFDNVRLDATSLAAGAPTISVNTTPVTDSEITGGSTAFTASITGSAPIYYQWLKNSGVGPVPISGATSPTLLLSNLQPTDAALYSLQASNSLGVAVTTPSSLAVSPAPAAMNNIVTAIANQTGAGLGTTFSPTWIIPGNSLIAGLPPSSFGSGNFSTESSGGIGILTDGSFGPIGSGTTGTHPSLATAGVSAGTTLTYSLPTAASGYDLTNVTVYGGWNDNGRDQQGYTVLYSTVASPNTFTALTTVNFNPTIASGAQSAIRASIASANAAPLAKNVAKVKFDFTTVSVENGYTGYAEIGLFGTPSAPLPLVSTPASSATPPVTSGTIVTLSENASGIPPLQFQWQTDNGTGGVSFGNISGATGSNYVLNTTGMGSTSNSYRVVVSDVNGSATSGALLLPVIDVSGKPVVTTPSSSPNSSVAAGTLVTLTESALGAQPLQYQWQSDNGSGGIAYSNISGATASNYVVDTTSFGNAAINYRVVVTNTIGASTSPALILTVTAPTSATNAIANLRCEHLSDPLGIDVIQPRLSWVNVSSQRGFAQTAYQILVASSPALLAQNEGDVWNSGKVASSQSVLVQYSGSTMTSGEICYWQVRVWDQNGNVSAWSPTGMWSMGLLNPSDWTAHWIGMNTPTNISPAAPSPMLRKTFTISKPVARATAYICGLGYYEFLFNGSKVGDHVLDPAWTRYDLHADYITYDVTTNLLPGENAIGVQLANGFYNQWTSDAWNTATAPWRALPQLLLQMDIQYTDGTHDLVVSDTSWKAATGALLLDTTRLGEVYDARLEQTNWATTNFDDSAWASAISREGISGALIAPDAEPVKMFQAVPPVKIIPVTGQSGVYTFDFGQNLVGWGQLTVSGPAGTSVHMVYGEKTNSDGSVDQSNINYLVTLQQYFQTDDYILKGSGIETWSPRFTYHGFRYAQVSGLPSAPTTNTLVARVVHTAFDPAGNFLCSSDLLNRIETNTLWSYLGDFVGIPTDCPTREKNGWTGDAQLACEIGLTHFHAEAAYTRWLKEFDAGQLSNGELSGVFPNAQWGYGEGPSWESAVLLIPWFVYQHCGDMGILTNNYAAMKGYVDYETSVASGNIVSYGLGDWEPASTVTPTPVMDTGYYYEGALIVAQTAAMLGKTADSQTYSNLASQINAAFNSSFFNPTNSQYSGATLTGQSCALYQGFVNSNQIPAVANVLVNSVKQAGTTMDTGILGSKYLLRALCDSGQSDTAIALAMQTNYPSWGYQIGNGATTLWETWSGAGSGDSLNHIMFGDISAWFIEYLAGIRPGTPGYKTILIKPEITGALNWAQATHDSPYGMISSAWQINGETVSLNVTIPPSTSAQIYLPLPGIAATNLSVQESGTSIMQKGTATGGDQGVAFSHFESAGLQSYAVWAVASGSYQFSWNISPAPNGLTAQPGNRWVSLSWTPTPGAASYNIKRASVSGGPYTTIAGNVFSDTYTDSTATNGTTWYYVISAIYSGVESPNSGEASATPSPILNFGFETPRISNYQYNVSGGSWIFSGGTGSGSGITGNNSAFTVDNSAAPEGTQVAFLQSTGTISQTLYGFLPGTNYTLTFSAAQRADSANQHGGESWNVKLDNTVVGSYNPGAGATSYTDYQAAFTASANVHTLSFVGTDLAGGDNTVFLDNVRISPALQPQLPAITLANPMDQSGFAAPATLQLMATVTTNGNAISSVEFLANTTNLIAQIGAPPYSYLWTNVPAGIYRISARAIFDGGNSLDSASANIVVSNTAPIIQRIHLNAGTFDLSGTGIGGQTLILFTSSNLTAPVTWIPVLTNRADASGNFAFTNLAGTNSMQFYRIAVP